MARPWNSDIPYGYLRLERGGSRFLRRATSQVLDLGMDRVASQPVTDRGSETWQDAGYLPFATLTLYRRSLIGPVPPESRRVGVASPDFERLAEIDRQSFGPLWRSSPAGLRESYLATFRRVILCPAGSGPQGYAIVGCSGVTSYLQRIAVAPDYRGRGWGSRLTLAGIRWAARHGAASMLLNTTPANRAAAALYRSTGFHRIQGRMRVFVYPAASQSTRGG